MFFIILVPLIRIFSLLLILNQSRLCVKLILLLLIPPFVFSLKKEDMPFLLLIVSSLTTFFFLLLPFLQSFFKVSHVIPFS
tara:strand:+ start:778 stop:1020 length:243 start_codon:yes stop_codon:yes gene_type:complete